MFFLVIYRSIKVSRTRPDENKLERVSKCQTHEPRDRTLFSNVLPSDRVGRILFKFFLELLIIFSNGFL